jgi:hypothetical protein
METNKVKIKSDGSLDRLKCRIGVRGDLQYTAMEDSWSPTAPFRSLKMFLADAARNKCRVYQLDFIGAFLQANVRGRIFVSLPKVYGDIWPEFKDYCGRPLRLVKSMYGMTYSGKCWYLDLKEWLLEEGFIQSRASPCFFCKIFQVDISSKSSCLWMINYSLETMRLFLKSSRKRSLRDLMWSS